VRVVPRGRLALTPRDGLRRGRPLSLSLDGRAVTAYAGETVAALLFADGGAESRTTVGGDRRGVFCGMGVCFDCLVLVNGVPNVRACMTLVEDGMRVERQLGAGTPR